MDTLRDEKRASRPSAHTGCGCPALQLILNECFKPPHRALMSELLAGAAQDELLIFQGEKSTYSALSSMMTFYQSWLPGTSESNNGRPIRVFQMRMIFT
jgi:hypothetical protein